MANLLVYPSTCLLVYLKKIFFFFFYPHTLTFPLKRPVYRGFKGEGKCEGRTFTLTLPSHYSHTPLTLPSHSRQESCLSVILWTAWSYAFREYEQWFTVSIAMLHYWCRYAATVGAPMLPLWYSYAVPSVFLCCTIGTRMLYSSGTVFLFNLQPVFFQSLY